MLRDAYAGALNSQANPATHPAGVFPPVLPGPDLVPVDDDPEPTALSRQVSREQGEVRKRRRMDDVVPPSMAQKVDEHAESEHEWRQEAPPSMGVELHTRHDCDDPYAGDRGIRASVPLPAGEEGNLVTAGCQSLGEVAVPPLSSADREGVETVVDDADAHDGDPSRPRDPRPRR